MADEPDDVPAWAKKFFKKDEKEPEDKDLRALKIERQKLEEKEKIKKLKPHKESDRVPLIIIAACVIFGVGSLIYGDGSMDFGDLGRRLNDGFYTVLGYVAAIGVCFFLLMQMFGTVTSPKKSSGKKDDHH